MPAVAAAEPSIPAAERYDVRYDVLDANGTPIRAMTESDNLHFLNRARCECGQQFGTRVRLKTGYGETYDNSQLIKAFIGQICSAAEVTPLGQFRPCALLASATVQSYYAGFDVAVHPVWMQNGVELSDSPVRDPAEAVAAGSCSGSGRAGVWMCSPNVNGVSGCQQDEFSLLGDEDQDGPKLLSYDFDPPTAAPRSASVEPYSGGALLEWQTDEPGDISGYRVLCAESGTGAPPVRTMEPPDIVAEANGEHYFNAQNVCGGQPFTEVMTSAKDGPSMCGDGVVQAGEACDDGLDNDDDGLCSTSCALLVPASLHDLDWAHVCSQHAEAQDGSLIVGGLENGKTYDLVLVTYDVSGNPRAFPKVLQVTPDAELPSLSEESEDGCGCRSSSSPPGLLLLGGLLMVRRRRSASAR